MRIRLYCSWNWSSLLFGISYIRYAAMTMVFVGFLTIRIRRPPYYSESPFTEDDK